MFIKAVFFIILLETEVFANYSEDQLTSDENTKHINVFAFLFGNDSIRLNITWGNTFGNDSIRELSIESSNSDGDCIYSSIDNVTNYSNIIVPSLDIVHPFENILPGCIYVISLEAGEETITANYTVPDCVENYCICLTNQTNLIKLVDVEYINESVYKVLYTSQNPSLERGNYYITKVSYVNENTDDYFDVPQLKYVKGAFEIPMEYLKGGENYTLIIHYRDNDNINPYCEYISRLTFNPQSTARHENYFFIKIVSSVFIFFFFAMVLLWLLYKWSKFSTKTFAELRKFIFPVYEESPIIEKKSSFNVPHQEINALYTPLQVTVDQYEIPRENLEIRDEIGEGAFGKVYYAKAYNINGHPGYTMVAVKLLREGAPKEELKDFQAEINMLKKIGYHKNVIKFLGCVTKSQPCMTIMELVANGDLKEYLLKLREIWVKNKNQRLFFPEDMEEKYLNITEPKLDAEYIERFDAEMQTPLLSDIGSPPDPILDHRELENFALQIATGMGYLEKIPVVHRDLAARNILITKEKVLKISDFGMSRCGPYVNRNLKKVPLRWMAIEAIEDFKTDSKSDVWSFGVVLWEIGTLGAFPYDDIPNDLIPKALKSGIRLPRPEICTDDLYALMQTCWMEDPNDRPTFQDIVEHINAKKQHVYVDFKKVNPKYVFPPTDP